MLRLICLLLILTPISPNAEADPTEIGPCEGMLLQVGDVVDATSAEAGLREVQDALGLFSYTLREVQRRTSLLGESNERTKLLTLFETVRHLLRLGAVTFKVNRHLSGLVHFTVAEESGLPTLFLNILRTDEFFRSPLLAQGQVIWATTAMVHWAKTRDVSNANFHGLYHAQRYWALHAGETEVQQDPFIQGILAIDFSQESALPALTGALQSLNAAQERDPGQGADFASHENAGYFKRLTAAMVPDPLALAGMIRTAVVPKLAESTAAALQLMNSLRTGGFDDPTMLTLSWDGIRATMAGSSLLSEALERVLDTTSMPRDGVLGDALAEYRIAWDSFWEVHTALLDEPAIRLAGISGRMDATARDRYREFVADLTEHPVKQPLDLIPHPEAVLLLNLPEILGVDDQFLARLGIVQSLIDQFPVDQRPGNTELIFALLFSDAGSTALFHRISVDASETDEFRGSSQALFETAFARFLATFRGQDGMVFGRTVDELLAALAELAKIADLQIITLELTFMNMFLLKGFEHDAELVHTPWVLPYFVVKYFAPNPRHAVIAEVLLRQSVLRVGGSFTDLDELLASKKDSPEFRNYWSDWSESGDAGG